MNETVQGIVQKHIPEAGSSKLSFVKFNTAGSPLRTTPNVLFFCFVADEQRPSMLLKTVRAPRDNAIIADAYSKLKALYALPDGAKLFTRPIWSGEVDGICWSIEEAAPGRRPAMADIPRVMDAYIAFQKSVGIKRTISAKEKAEELMRELGIGEKEHAALLDLWNSVPAEKEIALLPQHGDFTQDNVLVDGSRVTLIDCDSFMPEGIAGFDLFHFFSRTKLTAPQIAGYLNTYQQALGSKNRFDTGDLLLWVLQERALKRSQGAPRDPEPVLSAFERAQSLFGL